VTRATPERAAIVLAGGRSRRFGRDKLVERIDGRPLLDHAIEAVRSVPAIVRVVVVVAPDGTLRIPTGIDLAHDTSPFEGPLAGLSAGLHALDGLDPSAAVVVVGGDMPSLQPAVLEWMCQVIDREGGTVVVALADGDRPRPLPAVVRHEPAREAVDALLAEGERRLRALIDRVSTTIVPTDDWRVLDPSGSTLRDIDTPADIGGPSTE
jgi:molybdenum cofactor guanylyltransferase